MPINYKNMPKEVKKTIREERIKGESFPVLETDVTQLTIESNTDKNAPVIAAAEKFVDLVTNKRVTPKKAAEKIGTTIEQIVNNEQMKAAVEQLMFAAELPVEIRKRMLKAGLNKIFIENVNATEPKRVKIALEAAKQIGQDPEIGTQQPEGGVIINLGELESVRSKPLALPGIEPLVQKDKC